MELPPCPLEGYRLRAATGQDLPAITALEKLCMKPQVEAVYPGEWDNPRNREMAVANLSRCRVLMKGGEMAGQYYWEPAQPATACLLAIMLQPAHRGRGLGTWLMSCFEAEAKASGIERADLTVFKVSPAVGFYQRIGYAITGEDGPEAWTMEKELPPRCETPPAVNWEPEIREFERQDRASPPPTGAVVFAGSSSIRLWETLAADMAPLAVVNRGFGGSTMADVLRYAGRIVIPCRPQAVVVYEGDNDINRGASPAQVAAQAEELAGTLLGALPGVRLFFMGIKPSPSRTGLWPQFLEANRLLAESCHRAGHVYIDVAPAMLDASGRPRPELYVEDGLHMTPEGYRVWTQTVRPVLMRELGGSRP